MRMAHPNDFDWALESGCTLADHALGFRKMPEGYHLLLDADGALYFWMERATGREGWFGWDKWAAYRSAKADKARLTAPQDTENRK